MKRTVPPSGILGITDAQLSPEFWVAQLPDANKVVLDTAAIATLNERVARLDPSMHDIRHLPASLPRDQVKGWIEKLTSRPAKALFDVDGKSVTTASIVLKIRGNTTLSKGQRQRLRQLLPPPPIVLPLISPPDNV